MVLRITNALTRARHQEPRPQEGNLKSGDLQFQHPLRLRLELSKDIRKCVSSGKIWKRRRFEIYCDYLHIPDVGVKEPIVNGEE